jgi:hypothetical protein
VRSTQRISASSRAHAFAPPSFVTTGLDPVVHAEARQTENARRNTSEPSLGMDCRVKPGNDETENRSRGAVTRPSYANDQAAN